MYSFRDVFSCRTCQHSRAYLGAVIRASLLTFTEKRNLTMKMIKRFLVIVFLGVLALPAMAHSYKFLDRVYTMTNAAEGNEIIELYRHPAEGLSEFGRVATGGNGSGSGLGNQGALAIDRSSGSLYAVNAASNSISVFRILPSGLRLVEVVASQGQTPVSLTVHNNLLYVLNSDSDSIAGFIVRRNGKLRALAASVKSLSGSGVGAAQIGFSPWGDSLAVSEKASNQISVFKVNFMGLPSDAVVSASVGNTPFGFAFDRRSHLLVSEAAGGAADASSVSSYEIERDGSLEVIDAAVPTTETAACWLVTSRDSRYAFTTNAGSSSISAYRIARDGDLSLVNADGVAASTGPGTAPIDMALSHSGHHLFVLSAKTGSIVVLRVGLHGDLYLAGDAEGLPTTVNGLAAY